MAIFKEKGEKIMILLEIITNIIIPLLLLMTVGYMLNQIFSFDLSTLSKLNLYFYIPVLVFTKIYETSLNFKLFSYILLFLGIQVSFLYGFSYTMAWIFKFNKKLRSSFLNSTILINAGNFGIPVNGLVFAHDPLAMAVHIIVMTIQNFLTFSLGIMNAKATEASIIQGLKEYIKSPIFFALLLGLLGNVLNVEIPSFFKSPIWSIADGFFVFALITFGAQIAFKNIRGFFIPLLASVLIRLVLSPLLAFSIITLLQLEGVVAASLFIASALPTSRNSSIIALHYENHPDFAAQVVLLSTLLGSLTITFVIYFAKLLYL